jgi:PKD repeat protein
MKHFIGFSVAGLTPACAKAAILLVVMLASPLAHAADYTVTFDKQTGTGGSDSVVATQGSPMPAATAPTCAGYDFGGYYSGINGSGTQYYTAAMSSARNWDLTADTTLYAKWTASLAATPVAKHFVRGETQTNSFPVGYYQTVSDTVGTGGANGSRTDQNIVFGFALPILPVGGWLKSATFNFEITAAMDNTGGQNLPELHAYLLNSATPTNSGTTFFYHGALDPSVNAKRVGTTLVTISTNVQVAFPPGQEVRSFTLTGDALNLLRSFYDGNTPTQSTAYLRFNLSVDPAMANLRRYRVNTTNENSSLQLVCSPIAYVSATAAPPTGNGSGTRGLTTYAQRTRLTLTETPSDGTPPFTYAWKKVGSGAVLGTSSNLVVAPPVTGEQYYCEVAAALDNFVSISPTSTVTVTTAFDSNKVVIIKADDFRYYASITNNWSGEAWTNFFAVSRGLGVKVAPGVVATNIAEASDYMRALEAVGDVEIWNHGWDHSTDEFKATGLAFQQKHMADAQALLSNALGRAPSAFGAPFNHVDADTAAVLDALASMRLFFYLNDTMTLPRMAAVHIIQEADGTGHPNATTFQTTDFPPGSKGPVALQFHPAVFDAGALAEYRKILQYLLTNGYRIMLPSEYTASLPISASFMASSTNGGAPLTVTFSDTSLGTPTNRVWTFGDGATFNTADTTVSHTYRFPGTNTVRLILADASRSSTNTKSKLVIALSVDTIGDGIPNWWRAQYFGGDGSTTNDLTSATGNYTGMGLDNLSKYMADLNPTNPASNFAIVSLSTMTNGTLLWIGGLNATQSVESSSNLMDTNGWNIIYTNIPPTPVTNTLPLTGAGSTNNLFYRIRAWR